MMSRWRNCDLINLWLTENLIARSARSPFFVRVLAALNHSLTQATSGSTLIAPFARNLLLSRGNICQPSFTLVISCYHQLVKSPLNTFTMFVCWKQIFIIFFLFSPGRSASHALFHGRKITSQVSSTKLLREKHRQKKTRNKFMTKLFRATAALNFGTR